MMDFHNLQAPQVLNKNHQLLTYSAGLMTLARGFKKI
jgi:hypothetical protein